MTEEKTARLIQRALDAGFTRAAALSARSLTADPAARDACAANRCGRYGKCWTCPPHCGTLEACQTRLNGYRCGLLVQTVGVREDCFDYEAMQATEKRHNRSLLALTETLSGEFPRLLALGAGVCPVCESCACPGEPCRFPDKAIASMEAYGLLVSDACIASGLPYYCGSDAVAFFGCILLL